MIALLTLDDRDASDRTIRDRGDRGLPDIASTIALDPRPTGGMQSSDAPASFRDLVAAMERSIERPDAARPLVPVELLHAPHRRRTPVVIVTRAVVALEADGLRLHVGGADTVARGQGAIAALVDALRASPAPGPTFIQGLAIVQATAHAEVAVVRRVVESLRAASFDNVLFAVRQPTPVTWI
jgi:hypothetical protein